MMKSTLVTTINPSLSYLSKWVKNPSAIDNREAKIMLLTIGMQESALIHRRQIRGPARGLWQFEQEGGFAGVLRHDASKRLAELAADLCDYTHLNQTEKFNKLEENDIYACIIARLLLWTDPYKIPDNEVDAFNCYIRTWRPGAYTRGSSEAKNALRNKFISFYKQCSEVVDDWYSSCK